MATQVLAGPLLRVPQFPSVVSMPQRLQQPCVNLRCFHARTSVSTGPDRTWQRVAALSGGLGSPMYGPAPPPPTPTGDEQAEETPEWVQDLINDAPFDEEVAELLEGTGHDPEKIRSKMRASMAAKHSAIYGAKLGSDTPMRVRFREVDPTNLWLWFHLYSAPSAKEAAALQEVVRAWFMLGRLGGFNGMNLQAFHYGEDDLSYYEYDHEQCDDTLEAFMHEASEVETRGEWARCWVDLGTADEMCVDVLINALATLSRENLGIRMLLVGGENEDWPAPARLGGSEREEDVQRAALDMMRSRVSEGAE